MDSKQITICLAFLFLSIVPFSFSSRLLTSPTSSSSSVAMHLVNRKLQKLGSTHEYFFHHLKSDSLRVDAASSGEAASAPLSSGLERDNGDVEYVASVSIGTPPTKRSLVLDTWGEVVWLQCQTCTNCYNQITPIFNPATSTSYSTLECGDQRCQALQRSQASDCTTDRNPCHYNQTYGRDWYTSGDFSTETFMFGESPVENISFGCGHDNEGYFDDTDGFLSLSQKPMSFVSQTKEQFGKKFSYCLSSLTVGPASKSSSVWFGDAAVPANAGITSLLHNPNNQNYYVHLKGISVAGKRVGGFDESAFDIREDGRGGVIVDMVTAFIFWATPVHNAVTKAFREALNNTHMAEPPYPGLDTCYDLSNNKTLDLPTVVLHFKGLDLELPPDNYFTMNDYNGTFCLAFVTFPRNLSLSVIGSIAQQGMRVSYDLTNSQIGFTVNACS